ncbi:acyl-CoA dehydrogenase C-terminal domain-containing protein [Microbacterium sp. bgisy203]|uniref:acyl-CoA dehydrogenase C-terminal domain-containing protein n=1 Tax=Microbacterium sp. bgisy203 TaxID=3413799 RepID=UPI003D7182CC
MRATLSRAAREHAADAARLEELVARAEVVTAEVLAVDDPEARLADSAAYLEAMGHLVVAWLWLDLITTLDGREDAFAEGKRAACSYFFAYEVPKIAPLFDVVAARSRLLVDLDDSVL